MLKEKNEVLRKAQQGVDIGITLLSFFLAYEIRDSMRSLPSLFLFRNYYFILYATIPVWWFLLSYNGAYHSIRKKSFTETLTPVIKSTFTGGAILMTLLYAFRLEFVSRSFILIFLCLNTAFLFSFRVILFWFSRFIRKKGFNYRTIIVVGTGKRAEEFSKVLESHREWGVKVLGFVDHEASPQGVHVNRVKNRIGYIDDLRRIITSFQIDEAVFVVPRDKLDKIEEAVMVCEKVGIKASIAADLYPHMIAKVSMEEIDGWPLLSFNPIPKLEEALVLKRAVDIFFSFTLILVSSPVFLLALIGNKIFSKGPVFFTQERCGLNGRRFNLLKFRTMVVGAESVKDKFSHLNEMSGPVFKIKNDPRVTAFGRWLRKYSLDELPQLINVLRGDMSIVGPRPPLPAEVEKYDTWQRRRLSVKPGLTCFWQVNGRNNINFDEWMRLDLEYIDNWSFKQDIKIILKTIPAVLKGTGL